jgi:hypothetical protein
MTPEVLNADAHLFAPRAAYRFRGITAPSTPYDDPTVGENPAYGAAINYYLKQAVPAGATITIANSRGETVRTLTAPGSAGLNRVHWDLRYAPTKDLRFRTNPMFGHELPLGPDGWRGPAAGGGALSVLAPPGTYTVTLSVGGRELSQSLTVRKDPHSGGTEADIDAQTKVLMDLRSGLDSGVDAVNRLEFVRSQVQAIQRTSVESEVKQMAEKLHAALTEVEMNLFDLRITGGQDGVRYAAKLLSRFTYLANGIGSSDYRPTDQHLETAKLLQDRLRAQLAQLKVLMDQDVETFNTALRRASAGHVNTRVP